MIFKKTISALLIITILAVLSSCAFDPVKTTDEQEPSETMTETTEKQKTVIPKTILGYYKNDSLNPYKASGSTNAYLSALFCDCLVELDSSFSPKQVLAEKIENSGNTVKVKLKEGILFSDKTTLSASDVCYSFNLAKESSLFSERLYNISSASASDNSVVFTLDSVDVFAENCLDFPIVKTGTGSDDYPVGSGPYYIKNGKNGVYFKENKNYSFNEESAFTDIYLKDLSEVENNLNLIQIGDLSFYYDDRSSYIESETKVNANNEPVSQADFVFLTFNSKKKQINSHIKKAVNLSLSRVELTNSAFELNSSPALNLFHPNWNIVADIEESDPGSDFIAAGLVLSNAGYTFEDRWFYDKSGDKLELALVYCSEDHRNEILAENIKSMLEKTGIQVNLDGRESDHYLRAVRKGDYDLYIGRIKLCANMDYSVFFEPGGPASYGIDNDDPVSNALSNFRTGEIDAKTAIDLFNESLPFIPICYVNGLAYYSRGLEFEESVCSNNIYGNIYSWNY